MSYYEQKIARAAQILTPGFTQKENDPFENRVDLVVKFITGESRDNHQKLAAAVQAVEDEFDRGEAILRKC